MAKLTAARRKRMKSSQFALKSKAKTAKQKAKSGNYPIDTRARAVAALHYAAMHHGKSSSTYKRVRAAVCRKYPTFPSCKRATTARKKRTTTRKRRK